MDKRPIGVFDSGLGGLTAVKELIKRLPAEDIVYFGDTGRVPYGTRSKDTILKYAEQDVNFLLSRDIKMIIIACGTASSVAIDSLKKRYKLPIIGVVDASVKTAVSLTKTNKVAVLGTNGTIESGAFQKSLNEFGIEVFPVACPLFVPLVENNYLNHQATRLIAEDYLKPLMGQGIDTIILGCTHYPLLKGVIYDIMGAEVYLVDSGAATVSVADEILGEMDMRNTLGGGQSYFVSDSVEGFSRLGGLFLEQEIAGKVNKIDIERY